MSQPPVSRVNLQGTCVTLMIICKVRCRGRLIVHHLLTAASRRPPPGVVQGSQSSWVTRARPIQENHQAQNVVILMVWSLGLSLYVCMKGEHDFGLIGMATVTAVLLSPCAAQAWTSPSLPALNRLRHSSIFVLILFISVCFHVICVKNAISKTFLR